MRKSCKANSGETGFAACCLPTTTAIRTHIFTYFNLAAIEPAPIEGPASIGKPLSS